MAEGTPGPRIAVVGAGISGLAAAIRALDLGADVQLFESSSRAGGWIRTTREDRWIFEWGPHSVLPSSAALIGLAKRLGIEGDWRGSAPSARRRFIWRGGTLRALPSSPLTIPFSRALSPTGWLRILMEPFVRSRGVEEESVSSFFRRRFGDEAARVLADAMVAGVSGGLPEQLEMESFQPRMSEWERNHRSVLVGWARHSRPSGAPFQGTGTLVEGMESLPRAAVATLGDRFHPGSPVEQMEPEGRGWKLQIGGAYGSRTEAFDGVILALPADRCRQLVGPVMPAVATILETIPYGSLTIVQIGYDARKCRVRPDGFGFLAPREERLGVLGTIWSSSVFPFRAPEDRSLASVFMGGMRDPAVADLGDEEIEDRAVQSLRRVQGPAIEPELVQIGRAHASIPQQLRGHRRKVGAIQVELNRYPSVALAGSYLDGLSLESCTVSGQAAAENLMKEALTRTR